jgi:hypothetical protein
VRLTGPQPGEGLGVPGVWAAAEGFARARIPLVKHLKVIVGIDLLALTQAQCRQAGPEPHAGRLTLLSSIDVVAAGRPLATIRPGSTGRPQRILRVMPGGERHLVSHGARLPSCLKDLVVMIMVFTELTKITTSAMVRWLVLTPSQGDAGTTTSARGKIVWPRMGSPHLGKQAVVA